MATLRSTLAANQAAAAALTALADRRADKPRRNSTICVVYDEDGEPIGTEDVDAAPAAEGVEATPRIEEESV